MYNKRLEILISNLLGELYDKTFDCNSLEFLEWLNTEIGMTYEEMAILSIKDRFPQESRKYILGKVFKDVIENNDKD